MTATTLDLDMAAPVTARRDGLVAVSVAPMATAVGGEYFDAAAGQPLVSAALIVDYLAAAAKRAARNIRAGRVVRDPQDHWYHPGDPTTEELEAEDHRRAQGIEPVVDPETAALRERLSGKACLHCAVMGAGTSRVLSRVLLMLLEAAETTQDWNCKECTSDTNLASRLSRLPVSDDHLEALFGPHWAVVIFSAMRAEAADLFQVRSLVDGQPNRHTPFADPREARHAMSAYHLGANACPRNSWDHALDPARSYASQRLAVALAEASGGLFAEWLTQLPEPAL